MEKLIITFLLFVTFVGCSNSQKDMTFEIISVSSGAILDGNKAYESHNHEWKSSDDKMVSVELIKFASKKEAHSYLGIEKVNNMSSWKDFDGRLVDEVLDDTSASIILWKENKLVKILAPTLDHALAFEKCCSEDEYASF